MFLKRKLQKINEYIIPNHILMDFLEKTQIQNIADIELIIKNLKIFFMMCLLNKYKKIPVIMESQYVDELWHSFILDTREYQFFCKSFYGKIIHHTPAKKSMTTHIMIDNNEKLWNDLVNLNYISKNDMKINQIDEFIKKSHVLTT